jgi:hypothetical protein
MKEVLRESIEIYLEDAFPQSDEEESDTASDSNSTDPGLSKALDIASYLNGCEPEDVARAFGLMIEEYPVVVMLRLIPHLDKETVSKILKDEGIETNDIQSLSDSCFSLCQHLDTAFDLTSD